jgi:hypothetical protein
MAAAAGRSPVTAAYALGLTTVVVALCVSANLLTWLGVPYLADGGSLLFKLHPATWLSGLAAAARFGLAGRRIGQELHALVAQRALMLAIACFAFCVAANITTTGTSNVSVLLDTYIPALMLAAALHDLDQPRQNRLRRALQILFAANAGLALMESLSCATLVPVSVGVEPLDAVSADFRPTALYDHPLTGAAMTLIGIFVAPDRPGGRWIRILYIMLMGLGLIAFGARAAMAALMLVLAVSGVMNAWHVIRSRHVPAQKLATTAAVLMLGVIGCAAAACAGFAERLTTHFYWDKSAQVRLNQWQVLGQLDQQQMIFGVVRKDLLAVLEPMRLAYDVPVIENFWLLMFLSLGLVGFPFFVAGLGSLLVWCAARSCGRATPMVLCLLATASASNSLGRKSVLLLVLVAAAASLPPTRSRAKSVAIRASRSLHRTEAPSTAIS